MVERGFLSIKIIVALAFVVLLAILILQNKETTNIGIFFWSISAPKFILFIISFVIGIIIGWALCYAFLSSKKIG